MSAEELAVIDEEPTTVKNRKYTEIEQDEFCSLAVTIGIGPAIKELGYPSTPQVARRWLQIRGLADSLPTLAARAAVARKAYGPTEQLYVLSTHLERLEEKLQDPDLSARDHAFLAKAAADVVQTMRLIKNEATSIVQTVDAADTELRSLVLDLQAQNKARQDAIIDAEVVSSPSKSDRVVPVTPEIAGEVTERALRSANAHPVSEPETTIQDSMSLPHMETPPTSEFG